ncbi:uracil-DNA glycosylase family protein [Rhizobium sp. LCM 4573]|uniref:uracil-DNA glycosylase n=1 Tax=Rhizobium sp. LCM 4573 TaxID=1848291 RepID=UPI0008D9798C|nr:uracil-DNA glycosylase [Rhizobium sp. LCM 4573]OHV75671.1 uracil-DNA glycosylase [Rhizobium sp. LCM 4573]
MTYITDLDPSQLTALLHFYADAGVEWLVEDEPADRFAEFAAQKAARAEARATQQRPQQPAQNEPPTSRTGAGSPTQARTAPAARAAPAAQQAPVAVPDGEAVSAAQFAAESARSLSELKTALEAFNGCNLKNGARSTVFASGDPASRIMVIGPMPNADDDRDSIPFSGRQGQLLDRMLGAIGLTREAVMLTNVIPWRPPGNRMPSPAEQEICRPFLERQIALAEPRYLLLLGNFPARFFFGDGGTIHSMRGEWRDIRFAGLELAAIATLHPQELLAAPANKALAWQDLLTFKSRLEAV